MRPAVKRRLVTLAAVALLLLCVATVALWVGSYSRVAELSRRVSHIYGPDNAGWEVTWYLGSHRGGIYVADTRDSFDKSYDTTPGHIVTHGYLSHVSDPGDSDWALHYTLAVNAGKAR
jgi:hypothetical protein